jgi:hypothetical protein
MVKIYEYSDLFLENRIEYGYQLTIEEHMANDKTKKMIFHTYPNIQIGDKVKPFGSRKMYTWSGVPPKKSRTSKNNKYANVIFVD